MVTITPVPNARAALAGAAETLQDIPPALLPAKVLANDEQALSAARELASVARPGAAIRDRERQLPWAQIEQFSASGLGSILIGREFGGPQVSLETVAEVFRIISAADPALGQIPQNHFAILSMLAAGATPAQQRLLFQSVLEGARIGNGGPERGNKNTLELKARLVADADGYRVSGQKFYSTGALFAHWVAVKALDAEGRTLMAFIRRGSPGLRIIDDWSGFGQRTTASGTVLLEDVAVPAEQVVEIWRLADTPNIQGAISQLMQAAIDAGIAEAAIDDTIEFVRTRARPWIDAQVERAGDDLYVIADIGRLKLELHAAQALLRKAARVLDEIRRQPIDADAAARASIAVAEAKALTTQISLQASEKLFELAGSRATLAEFNLDRHWRNARVHTLHDPVRWKYHAVGAWYLNGQRPARHSWI